MFDFLKKKQVNGVTITFRIDGMHCASCSLNIDGVLEDTNGVFESQSNFAKGTARVVYDPLKVTPQQLEEVIEKAGYKARIT